MLNPLSVFLAHGIVSYYGSASLEFVGLPHIESFNI